MLKMDCCEKTRLALTLFVAVSTVIMTVTVMFCIINMAA